VTQRIQFLEAKGLTPPEIDIALKQASAAGPIQSVHANYPTPYGPNQYAVAPMPGAQHWDWRDYFVSSPFKSRKTHAYLMRNRSLP